MDAMKQKRIEKLFAFSKQLEQESNLQITALSPIKKLVENKVTTLNYYVYLLEKSFDYYQLSQSLSTVQLVNNTEKLELYLSSIEALQCFIQSNGAIVQENKLLGIYDHFQQQFPGWKRVSIHATRRRLKDPDLLLIEQTARYAANMGQLPMKSVNIIAVIIKIID